MELTPYINYRGDCEAAFTLYAQCFGGRIVAMFPWAEAPEDTGVPQDWKGKVMHARVEFNGAALMGCDAPPNMFEDCKGTSISASLPEGECRKAFDTLAAGGQVRMPLGQTFFARQFGMLVDRFGVPWMIVSDEKE